MCISFAFNGIAGIEWFKIDILVKCACKQCQKKFLVHMFKVLCTYLCCLLLCKYLKG
jgi:hypothetical protein